MKSHGILSRYMRPGFEEGGDSLWSKVKNELSEIAKPGNTYDERKRKEIDKQWAERKDQIDYTTQHDMDTYNILNDNLRDIVHGTGNPNLKGLNDINTKHHLRGNYLDNLDKWYDLASTGRLPDQEGVKIGPEISDVLTHNLLDMEALPIGTREVRPGDYDERVLRWDEVESARKNKDFRDDRTRDDYFFNPGEYMRYLDQSYHGLEEGEEQANPYHTEREDRYLNANTPAEYKRLLNRRSWDTPKELGGMSKDLYDFYYNQGSIKKGTEGMTDEEKSQYVQDLDREAIGSLINNLSGGAKLAAELFFGYGARSILPTAPGDIKKHWGDSKGWFKGEDSLWNKVMYDEDRNRAWGLYDNTIAPLMGWDDPEKYPTMAETSSIPGFSDLLGGKEGAGTNPYFGYEGGFQPNEDLYTEEAYKVAPEMKMMVVMEEIDKETKLNKERIREAIESGMSEEEAEEMYPNTRAEGWAEQVEAGEYPVNIDYSKYNRLNIRRNVPAQLVGLAGTFMLPGKVGQAARALAAARAWALAGGKAGAGLAIAGKGAGTKAIVASGAGAGFESLGDKTPKDVDLGPDFFDPSVY